MSIPVKENNTIEMCTYAPVMVFPVVILTDSSRRVTVRCKSNGGKF